MRRFFATTLAVAFAALMTLPALATATNYEVDSIADVEQFEGCVNVSTECSLRDAILRANEGPGADEVTFGELAGPITLTLDEPLPPVNSPLTIDGTTAADYSDAGHPVIVLDGSAIATPEPRGIELQGTAGDSRVEGLAIGGFYLGIFSYSTTPNFICDDYIGLETDGVTPLPNEYAGVTEVGASNGLRIGAGCDKGNVISGNEQFGILEAGEDTVIGNNLIGLDVNGDPLPNGSYPAHVSAGIFVNPAASGTFIGGETGVGGWPANTIAHNEGAGIRVYDAATDVEIRRNPIFANLLGEIDFIEGIPTPAPVVDFFKIDGGETETFGTITGAEPSEQYALDFFASEACESGPGEGELFLGVGSVETDATGFAIFSAGGLAVPPGEREYMAATATPEAGGSTSAFSACYDQPPSTELTAFPDDPTSSTGASFAFTGSDLNGSVDGFLCRLDGAGLGECTSPTGYTELADGSHSFEVLAFDKSDAVDPTPVVYTWTVDTSPDEPPAGPPAQPAGPAQPSVLLAPVPQNGETVAVAPAAGKVFVLRPGEKQPTLLKEGQTIPVGSLVDATRGKVTLTSVNAAGETQTAVFYGGRFLIAQHEGSGLVILKLRGQPGLRPGAAVERDRLRPLRAPPLGQRQGQLPHRRQLRLGDRARDDLADRRPLRRHLLQGPPRHRRDP